MHLRHILAFVALMMAAFLSLSYRQPLRGAMKALSLHHRHLRLLSTSNTIKIDAFLAPSSANPIFEEARVPFRELLPQCPTVINSLEGRNLTHATSIQSKSIPKIMEGHDVVIGAETGSGKTLSYMLPLLAKYGAISGSKVNARKRGLILAPTNFLCDQIQDMATHLFTSMSTEEERIVLDRRSDSFFDWLTTTDKLHVTLCTPKVVADAVRNSNHFDPEHPFRALDFLVMDEADMLLDGSYIRDVEVILDKLRLVRRTMVNEGLLSINQKKVQFILAAATIPTFGLKSTKMQIQKMFPQAVEVKTENLHQHHPSISQEFIQLQDSIFLTPAHAELIMEKIRSMSVAVPTNAKEGTDAEVQLASTMVFLNNAEHARAMFTLFEQAGWKDRVVEVHNLLSKQEREKNLLAFRNQKVQVLIGTDACARGLDIPHVRCVVQADFALNVVQHLHRIGRASRGGRMGTAFNMYTSSSKALVDSITGTLVRSDGGEGSSIEKSFSRRRGFRQKLRRDQKQQQNNALDV